MNLKYLRELIANGPDDMDISSLLPEKEVIKVVSPELPTEMPKEEGYIPRVKHSVNIGDLWGAMGAIKRYSELFGRKIIVSQTCNLPAAYYPGATHPTQQDGSMVTMNDTMWEMCKPLVEHQDYIHSFEKYEGQKIDVDFDTIRQKVFVNLPHGALPGWIPLGYPDLQFDMSKPWIFVKGDCPEKIKEQVRGKAIINFTERYRNHYIDYNFLRDYSPDLIFAGTEREHFIFCQKWQLNIPRLQVDNFLELGYAVRECRFVLANQSQLWNLCESMKRPRVLEICQYAQNCQTMVGEDSYGFFHQTGAAWSFRELHRKTISR